MVFVDSLFKINISLCHWFPHFHKKCFVKEILLNMISYFFFFQYVWKNKIETQLMYHHLSLTEWGHITEFKKLVKQKTDFDCQICVGSHHQELHKVLWMWIVVSVCIINFYLFHLTERFTWQKKVARITLSPEPVYREDCYWNFWPVKKNWV